jgi:hypothetical protein
VILCAFLLSLNWSGVIMVFRLVAGLKANRLIFLSLVLSMIMGWPALAAADSFPLTNLNSSPGYEVTLYRYTGSGAIKDNSRTEFNRSMYIQRPNGNWVVRNYKKSTPNTAEQHLFWQEEKDLLLAEMEAQAYCIDLDRFVKPYDVYTMDEFTYSESQIQGSLAQLEAAWLVHEFSSLAGGQVGKDVITALQIAIWEVTYDHDATYLGHKGSDLYDGKIIYGQRSNSANILTLAETYLDAMPKTLSGLRSSMADKRWGIASGRNAQTLVWGAPGSVNPSAVPEPGTMLLFGSAMGLGAFMRRRKAKKQTGADQTAA